MQKSTTGCYNYNVILPSKKVLSVFIITAALVVAIIIAFGKDKSSTAINFASDLIAGEKLTIPENQNWQDELTNVVPSTNQVATKEDLSENGVTDTVATTLISNYIALKQNGSLTGESAQKLIDQTIEYVEKNSSQTALISESGLNIVSDNGKTSISQYGENLGMIFKTNKPKVVRNEMEIITQIVESKDSNKMSDLNTIIAVYEKILAELIKMPVPKTFVKAHLDMTNGVKGMIMALTEIKTVLSDPVKSLSAMELYQEGSTIFIQAKQATNIFIIQNNIVYKQGTGGYYLLYGI
ncbi:MAG: hypothetical protein A2431_02905 [Candidatus Zambryskibacteria bacterium RIFOXYC1_FULL_39_10]|uniref:Uncharacterized protein n=1 Tax=Candidatus Zambryskibacteria bacterium RIFOXYC1_FULL_39_10 TaxID=1802779 RepID=A0A1G2V024_9BACT|nr:MAG: hypothetical protein A2605_02165 [Candidatus Zambryskibacteria bacterium RIFOXYD1_FULL_39_35]OHB14972.1 MAG: hypothetical protein A2431_02905 [Candidatus Zambryskibacteria bacterium RIFOXYC1_FULL_39_10]